MKLSEHIKDEIEKMSATMIAFEETTPPEKIAIERPKLVFNLFRQSLKSIAYKSKENAFNILMSCMPKSAENINTITPEDARKMLQDFVKKYWYKDE